MYVLFTQNFSYMNQCIDKSHASNPKKHLLGPLQLLRYAVSFYYAACYLHLPFFFLCSFLLQKQQDAQIQGHIVTPFQAVTPKLAQLSPKFIVRKKVYTMAVLYFIKKKKKTKPKRKNIPIFS